MFLSGFFVYSIIMIYTTFAALYMVIIQLKDHGSSDKDDKLSLGNNMFTNIIVSTLSTVGLYFLMSFLYLDPWHMFTSSAQYFALLPSYICTLQVYAFCNTHDVTWGTKGDNVINRDLGTARAIGSSTVEVEMPSEQLDIDSGYDEALRNLRDRLEVKRNDVSESQMQEDYYRAVRTYMVAVYMTCNAVLAMAISESYGGEHTGDNIYLAILLWSVAALAIFRALGSSAFGIIGIIHKIAEARIKFAAASTGGGTVGLGGSVIGSSSGGGSSRGPPVVGGGGAKEWVSEAGWNAKRKLGSLMFWRK
jgi:chitin synthase